MKYIVLFEDNDANSHKRSEFMADHLAFLAKHSEQIDAAGPLFDANFTDGAGGLWLVEADSADGVDALVKSDPFWPTGLRKSYKILGWKQVFTAAAVQQ